MLTKYCKQTIQAVPLLSKTASSERKIVPVNNKEFRYLRFRAIGNLEKSGPNGNNDAFPYEHFEDNRPGFGYKSFIGKRAHYEHNSQLQHTGSIGDLPDAYLNKFKYSDDKSKWSDLLGNANNKRRKDLLDTSGQRDGAIEVLMRIDTTLADKDILVPDVKKALQRIVRAIDTGQQLTCSMGANIEYSVCSVCGNKAAYAHEYCDHIKKRKGSLVIIPANQLRDLLNAEVIRPEWLPSICASAFDVNELINGLSNKGIAARGFEINHILSFFELSVVAVPAFPEAYALEKVANLNSMDPKDHIKKLEQAYGKHYVYNLYNALKEEEYAI